MSRRKIIQARLHMLHEMEHIMDSMKTLALLETRKLAHYLGTQQRVVNGLEESATAFISTYPDSYDPPAPKREVWLMLGSERGFCGDFNEQLLRVLNSTDAGISQLIVIGRKLAARLEKDPRLTLALNGPAVAEEVPAVLSATVTRLQQLESRLGPYALTVLSHDERTSGIEKREVMPPFRHLRDLPDARRYRPRLYMAPDQFFEQLVEHYLFAILHERFYASLMMENRQRMEHLDGALQHLSKATTGLQLRSNYLRQEEITEELEELLLGGHVFGPESGYADQS